MSQPHLRQQRTVFLLFLGACFVAIMAALPIVTAQTQKQMQTQRMDKSQPQSAAAGGTAATNPEFDRVDRNKDGFIDKGEAGVVPGLSANFERADTNKDGKLDAAEFQNGLQILQVRR
jgi:hypothetical protein